jgi:spermidine/putrescine transport system substrate-binding protein
MVKPISRRRFLEGAALGVGLPAILAACTGDPTPRITSSTIFDGEPEDGAVRFANWPLYIDRARGDRGDVTYPSLDRFRSETGIEVEYEETAVSDASFLRDVESRLGAGDPALYDLLAMSDGPRLSSFIRSGHALPVGEGARPNFDANGLWWAADPPYDPRAAHTIAWQSGITGIAVNRDLLRRDVTKLDDLANPAVVGFGTVGMLRDDAPDWVMLNLGIDPSTSGPEEWGEAAAWLLYQREQGVVRAYYVQEYVDDLLSGRLTATMAWSGEVFYYRTWEGLANLGFVGPPAMKGLLWTDALVLLAGTERPDSALALMDHFYRPEIAAMVTEWVLTTTPVAGVAAIVLDDARAALDVGNRELARRLEETARDPHIFPDGEILAATAFRRVFVSDEEHEAFQAVFAPIWR